MKDRTKRFQATPEIVFIVKNAKALRQSIGDVTPTPETVAFRDLLVGILNCAIEDFHSVMVGADESVSLMAWGCRNLLEMRVVTLFALASSENAERIISDSIADGKEFFEAFSAYQRLTHKQLIEETRATIAVEADEDRRQILQKFLEREITKGTDTAPFDTQADEYRKRLIQHIGSGNTRPLMAGAIAERVGLKEHFNALNRVLSKIVHRTSLSISATLQKDSLTEAIAAFRSLGALTLLQIVIAIESHYKEKGVAWPDHI
jgi:hypothetical protein